MMEDKQTFSFDGKKTVEIKTEIVEQKPKVYNDLSKKQEKKSNLEVLDDNILAAAMKKLNKLGKRVSQPKCSDQGDMLHVLDRAFMKNMPH